MTINEYVLVKESQLEKVKDLRQHTVEGYSQNHRKNEDIDYARIIYSSSFRRLQGKMQMLVPKSNAFYRNRLTHSLEVSQIAKSLASMLNLKDQQTIQSCSLAHDLGNPPFGHFGEKILNNLNTSEKYEGNAQTFRILTNIEEKFHDCNGLNLTMRTLLGVIKYLDKYEQNNNKFLYDEDYTTVSMWFGNYNIKHKTIDCEIMDLSDEIAYAAHDLEDCLKLGIFNIDEILYEFSISEFNSSFDKFNEIVKEAKEYGNKAKTYNTSEEFTIYFIKKLTSRIVDLLVRDIDIIVENGIEKLGYKNYKLLAKGLKTIVFKAINRKKDVYLYEKLGEKVISGLYEVYSDEKFNKDLILLPPEYRDNGNKVRAILDYIGGMMDSYAIETYKTYFGENSLDKYYNF